MLHGVCVAIQELKKAQHERERLFARRQEEQERAQITLRSIADGVIVTDARGTVTQLNPAAARLTGWSAEQARGRHASEVLHVKVPDKGDPEPHAATLDPIELSLRENRVVLTPRNTTLIGRHGAGYLVGYACAPPHILGERHPEGAVLTIHDVTESKGLLDDLTCPAIIRFAHGRA